MAHDKQSSFVYSSQHVKRKRNGEDRKLAQPGIPEIDVKGLKITQNIGCPLPLLSTKVIKKEKLFQYLLGPFQDFS